MAFDIAGARKEGYSDAEIVDHLSKNPDKSIKFDVGGALKEGYSPSEVLDHISPKKTEPSALKDVAKQTGAGLLQGTANIPGAPALAAEGISRLIQPLLDKVLPEWKLKSMQEEEAKRQQLITDNPTIPQRVEKNLNEVIGAPETNAGRYARAGASAVPGMVLGSTGSIPRAVTAGVGAGVGATAATDAAEGTGYEGLAGAAGGLAGAVAGHGALPAAAATGRVVLDGAKAAAPFVKEYGLPVALDLMGGHGVATATYTLGKKLLLNNAIKGLTEKATATKAAVEAEAAPFAPPMPWGEAPRPGPTGPSMPPPAAEPPAPGTVPPAAPGAPWGARPFETVPPVAQSEPGLAQPPKGFAPDLVAATRAVNKISKQRDGQVTMEAMPLIKQLAQQNKREPYNTPSVQDIGKPWDTPSVQDIGKPWATPQVGPGQPVPLGLPKPAWQQPGINEVPPRPPMQMPQGPQPLALPPPGALRPGPASPFPGAPQGAPIAMPGPQAAPPPALVAQVMAKLNGQRAAPSGARPATIMPAPKRALEAPAADDLAIPAFLRRDASNAVPSAAPVPAAAPVAPVPSIQATKVLARMSAAEKIAAAHNAKVNGKATAAPELPAAPEGSPHYLPGDLKSTIGSARNDFLSSKGIDPEGPLPNWMSKSLGTIERIITDKVKTGEKLAKEVPGFDVHDFTSRYVHSRTFAGGEQLKARMKAQYPGHADAFDKLLSNEVFSTLYKNKTSRKDGTR